MHQGMIIFCSVRFGFYKKEVIKPIFFFKTETEPKPVQTNQFWFFRTKTGSNRFGSVFFPVWVWFGFFGFRLIKPKPNRTGRFFKIFNRFNRFFSRFGFFSYFFSGFLGF
jgi:hypothetical protein